MQNPVLFYVSGHGFGHARRQAQVISALLTRRPDAQVHVRTTAAARLFEPLPAERVSASQVDAGMAEDGPLTIDRPATLERLEQLVARRDAIVAAELAAVREIAPRLIVADVPFLAGDVADAAGVPCIAISNFTWDWICEPLFACDVETAERGAALLPVMRAGYAKMDAALRLPFGGLSDAFRQVVPVPLLAARSHRDRATILSRAGISTESRPLVLIGMRGGMPEETIIAAATDAPDFLFISPAAASEIVGTSPPNLRFVPTGPELNFTDLVSVCDVVASKLGYGTVAECIAGGSRMLWPRRSGFREDDVMIEELPPWLTTLEISREDFAAGRWGGPLRKLMTLPPPKQRMRIDGAEVCAEYLAERLTRARKCLSS